VKKRGREEGSTEKKRKKDRNIKMSEIATEDEKMKRKKRREKDRKR
jgi:hypothetical protein